MGFNLKQMLRGRTIEIMANSAGDKPILVHSQHDEGDTPTTDNVDVSEIGFDLKIGGGNYSSLGVICRSTTFSPAGDLQAKRDAMQREFDLIIEVLDDQASLISRLLKKLGVRYDWEA